MTVNSDGRIAVSKSINVGTPDAANPWQSDLEGSYFNNFTSTTDVSTMLRFIAGLLSQSAPDASPNTRTWNNTTASFSVGSTTGKSTFMSGVLGGSTYRAARLSQEWNQSTFISSSATSSYRSLQSYLIGKGWLGSSETGSNVLHDVGTNPFGQNTYGVNIPDPIYSTFGTFTFDASSGVTGTTTFSSSLGSRAFGLGSLTSPTVVTPYSVNIKGKKWKDFENDDHARAVMDKLKAKFKADGRNPETITIAPTEIITGEATALEKFRKAADEREKKHDAAEKEMKDRHARGEEDMKGSIDRLEKHMNNK
jgi:hypothetical protein